LGKKEGTTDVVEGFIQEEVGKGKKREVLWDRSATRREIVGKKGRKKRKT